MCLPRAWPTAGRQSFAAHDADDVGDDPEDEPARDDERDHDDQQPAVETLLAQSLVGFRVPPAGNVRGGQSPRSRGGGALFLGRGGRPWSGGLGRLRARGAPARRAPPGHPAASLSGWATSRAIARRASGPSAPGTPMITWSAPARRNSSPVARPSRSDAGSRLTFSWPPKMNSSGSLPAASSARRISSRFVVKYVTLPASLPGIGQPS